jgi:hypothetical protein
VHRLVSIVALLAACSGPGHSSSAQPWPADCPPTAPRGSKPIEDSDVESLRGHYKVTLVSLSQGPYSWTGSLHLVPTDTLRRFYVQTLRGYVKRGERPLAGEYRDGGDSLPRVDEAEVEDGVLFLGCRRCMDGSPYRLRLLAQTSTIVWGLWEDPQSGIERVADSGGQALPNPAGYFCLTRVG